MRKETYYVTVDMATRAGEIRTVEEKNDGVYDYEIRATRDEIDRLGLLFEELQDVDWSTFIKAHTPFLDNESVENLQADELIVKIYRTIHQLGTEETRRKMEEAGLIH